MEFTQRLSYPGTVDEVVNMYMTPDYVERRFARFAVEGSCTVSVEGGRVSLSALVRPELIPAAASRFVKADLRLSLTEEWTREAAGARAVTSVSVEGAPVSVAATSTLSPDEQGCVREVSGSVSVRFPLLGARIEREAVARLDQVAQREQQIATEWLGEHR